MRARFDESPEWLAGQFATLLDSATATPDRAPGSLKLISPSAGIQSQSWNRTESVYPQDSGLHELFSKRAAAIPETIAIVSGHRTWTYAELDFMDHSYCRRIA